LADQKFLRFVREHEDDDVTRLLLGRTPEGVDPKQAADQILARRKAKAKLPGWHADPGVIFPPAVSVEQASSELAARYKATLLEGEHLVDLTGGMGVDLLALAPRFATATYVEPDPVLCERFKHNAGRLSSHPIDVVEDDAESFLDTFTGRATFFLDPARRDQAQRRVFRFEDCRPDVTSLLPRLEQTAERVLIKASPMIDLTEGVRRLRWVREVHVVAVANDCKEVLFLLDFACTGEPTICCVDLGHTGEARTFRFDPAAERAASVILGELGRYLYDPGPAIRKAGAFKSVANAFGLTKLAPNTHLYTADEPVDGFPGRVFEVAGDAGRRPHRLLPDGRAKVISRNHPLSADALRQRFRIREGGDHVLVGYRDRANRPRLVVARSKTRSRET
jgi:hypothetical protein